MHRAKQPDITNILPGMGEKVHSPAPRAAETGGQGRRQSDFFQFPLDKKRPARYNTKSVQRQRVARAVNPAENAADTSSLRCFRVDTKAAVFLRKNHLPQQIIRR